VRGSADDRRLREVARDPRELVGELVVGEREAARREQRLALRDRALRVGR
jgi:hypothetical protein